MAIVLALLTSVFVGLADFTSGNLTKRVSAFAVAGGASIVAAVIYVILGLRSDLMVFDKVDIVAGIVSGTLFFIGNILYLKALSQGSMGVIGAVATLLVLVPLIWDIRHGNMPDAIAIVGVIVTLSGIILLGAPEMKGKSSLGPVFLAVIAALFFGISQVSVNLGSQSNVLGTVLLTELVTVVIVLVLALFTRSTGGMNKKAVPLILAIGLLEALALLSFSTATTGGNVAIVSVLSGLDPIVLAILALFLLKERMTRVQVIGFIIVIGGSFLVSF
ncbi:MAG: EamA family transporter [Actinobacteria bacterium]|nr:EamA family transporter [Actinomycetota bacterium]